MKKRNDEKQQKIAKERVELLFQSAEKAFSKNTKRADRYIEIARRIAMKMNLRLTKEQKRKFCKYCYSYLVSGVNATNRTRKGKVITACKICKKYTRHPIGKKQKIKSLPKKPSKK